LQFTLGILLEQITSQLNVDAANILLHRAGASALEYEASRGFRTNGFLHSKLNIGEGLAGRAAHAHKTIHIPDLSIFDQDAYQRLPIVAEGFVGYYGIPLIAKGQVKGVLEIFLRAAQ